MTDAPGTRGTRVPDPIGLLRGLRQTRHFRADPVPEAVLRDILEVARWSGSGANRQPWEFVVVRDPGTLAGLGELAANAAHLGRAPLAIAVVMPGGQIALDAFDEGRAVERMAIAATAHGLGAGIGWILADKRDAARELLDVPADRLLRSVLAIGYPAGGGRRATGAGRKPLADLVHDERW
ncbi:MAG TPA: nitroreductase family protein [Candidatus Limnocylindria bacterium]|nr:nitroreductase family protein [Candidatus Limnocylindria bacterium]